MKFEDSKGRCLIHFEKKVCFLKIDKCGGSTVFFNLFKDADHEKTWRWDNYIENPNILKDNYVFCVLRDPIERLVSGYLEILRRKDFPAAHSRAFYGGSFQSEEERFLVFLDDLEKNTDWNGHCARQKWFITDEQNEIIKVDDFWPIKDLTKKMKEKFDLKIDNYNVSDEAGRAKNLINFINNDSNIKNKIKSLYKEDYQLIHNTIGDKL